MKKGMFGRALIIVCMNALLACPKTTRTSEPSAVNNTTNLSDPTKYFCVVAPTNVSGLEGGTVVFKDEESYNGNVITQSNMIYIPISDVCGGDHQLQVFVTNFDGMTMASNVDYERIVISNNKVVSNELSVVAVVIPPPELPSNVIYFNGFNDSGDLQASDWDFIGEIWGSPLGDMSMMSLQDGWLRIAATVDNFCPILATNIIPITTSNYTIEGDFRGIHDSRFSFVYHYQEIYYYSLPYYNNWCYSFGWDADVVKWHELAGVGSTWEIADSELVPMINDAIYHFKVVCHNGNVQAYINNQLLIDASNTDAYSISGKSYPYFAYGTCGPSVARESYHAREIVYLDNFLVYKN